MAKGKPFFKLPFKFPKIGTQQPQGVTKSTQVMKLAIFIIDWNKIDVINHVFGEEQVRFHFISKGRGTATSDILDLLGIGASDKAVVFCLEQEVLVPVLLREVRRKIGVNSPGVGIAFTIPLSGINTPILKVFKESILQNEKLAERKDKTPQGKSQEKPHGGNMAVEIKHDLIISIINQGYSDEFMTLAHESGAQGGTVISARGLAHAGPVKFFGVSVQDEKEIVLILTDREKKLSLMQALSRSYGITSKAGGIVFSLPVDGVMGMRFE